jgi:nitrate reductase assembly molybdenum cofactor insertion protein NarJ
MKTLKVLAILLSYPEESVHTNTKDLIEVKAIISIESPNDSFASLTSHKDKYSKNNGK